MTDDDPGPELLEAVPLEAFVYLFPLVLMELTRRQMTNVADPGPLAGPEGGLVHLRRFPPGDFKGVVRPNFDTLYSTGWFDVAATPYVVTAPEATGYVMLPVLDLWTDVVAAPGVRTNGSAPFRFAICHRDYRGPLPDGVDRIDVATGSCWMIGRVATDSPTEYGSAHRFQDGMTAEPLDPAAVAPPVVDPDLDMRTPPLRQIRQLGDEAFVELGLRLLGRHGPHPTDWAVLTRMARLGLVGDPGFAVDALDPAVRAALDGLVERGHRHLRRAVPTMANIVNGWQMNVDGMGVYGNSYLRRAVVSQLGLGANPPEDAVYPSLLADAEGAPVSGDHRYRIRMEAADLPPVGAFWSVTAYDAKGFTVPNELDRYALGDRSPLAYGADGSLELTLGVGPGDGPPENWLPIPEGPVIVTMRLYLPGPEVLDGRWRPPPVVRVD